jgi:hypothetical protein
MPPKYLYGFKRYFGAKLERNSSVDYVGEFNPTNPEKTRIYDPSHKVTDLWFNAGAQLYEANIEILPSYSGDILREHLGIQGCLGRTFLTKNYEVILRLEPNLPEYHVKIHAIDIYYNQFLTEQ